MFMSPRILNSDFGLYKYFEVISSLFRNSLISHVGVLYRFNIIRLNILVAILIAQFSKSFSLQYTEISILMKCRSVLTKIQLLLSVGLFAQNLNLTSNHSLLGGAVPVQPCGAHLDIICGGLYYPFQNNVVIHQFYFSNLWYCGERY